MQYFNIHCHVFTMRNAPKQFLQLYLPKWLANQMVNITSTTLGSKIVKNLLNFLGGNGGKRYASFLAIGQSLNQVEVFEQLRDQYEDKNLKFNALTMNMEGCGAGPSSSGFEGQLEEILVVKKRYPDLLNIFLGIDPRWKTGGSLLKQTVENYFDTPLKLNDNRSVNPFCGLKIYPSIGFYPFDWRLMSTFEWAAENKVPVLSHCNYLGGIYNNDPVYLKSILSCNDPYNNNESYVGKYIIENKFKTWLLGTRNKDNKNSCSYFLEPAAYETLLAYFKKKENPLKLCLAHFGGENEIKDSNSNNTPYGIAGVNWFNQIKSLMTKYDNLYTDISYAVHDENLFDIFIEELNNPIYGNRILFGTDFFLTEKEQAEKNNYMNFKEYAIGKPLSNYGNVMAWDQIAGTNVQNFLSSKYCY